VTNGSFRMAALAPVWLALALVGGIVGTRILSAHALPKRAPGPVVRTQSMFAALTDPSHRMEQGSIALMGSSTVAAGWRPPEIEEHLRAAGIPRKVYNFGVFKGELRHQIMISQRIAALVDAGVKKRFRLALVEIHEQSLASTDPEGDAMAFRIALAHSTCGHFVDTVPPLTWLDRKTGYDRLRLITFSCLLGGHIPEENVWRLRNQITRWSMSDAARAQHEQLMRGYEWRAELAGAMPYPKDPVAYAQRLAAIAAELPAAARDEKRLAEARKPYLKSELDRAVQLAVEWKQMADEVIVVRTPVHPLFRLEPPPAAHVAAWKELEAALNQVGVRVVNLDDNGFFEAKDYADDIHFERIQGSQKAAGRIAEMIAAQLGRE
jgi:hypothetical protein